MNQVANKIKEKIKDKGGNKSEIGRLLGVSSQLLGQYERGRQKPKPDFYLKWKEVYGEDLLTETIVSNENNVLLKPLDLGNIKTTVADYINLQGEFIKHLLQGKEANSTAIDVQLGELMKTMRIDHSQILQALDKVLALPPGSLSKETDKIKDAVDKKVKERSNSKDLGR